MLDNLNPQLQKQIKAALEEMNNHPDHRLSPASRREIYAAFGSKDDQISQKARGWLGVLAARRVLPLFYEVYPNDEFPQQILDTAIGLLQGRIDEQTAYDAEDDAYHVSGNAWGHGGKITIVLDRAATASYHALKEARGFEPLTQLQKYASLGTVTMPNNWFDAYLDEDKLKVELDNLLAEAVNKQDSQFAQFPEPITGDKWTDEDVGGISDGDTASAAAVATAYNTPDKQLDHLKFQEFWTWWLTEAIPLAWEVARTNQLPEQKVS